MNDDLLGVSQEEAIKKLQKSGLAFSTVYAEDKKTVGKDAIVIAVRTVDKQILLVVGRFKTDVTKE